jgi:hypothetical protein
MRRDRQFDHAKVRAQVAAGLTNVLDQKPANLRGKLWKLLRG